MWAREGSTRRGGAAQRIVRVEGDERMMKSGGKDGMSISSDRGARKVRNSRLLVLDKDGESGAMRIAMPIPGTVLH